MTNDMPDIERQFVSVGHLAAAYQVPVSQVRTILSAAGQRPALALNDVLYYPAAVEIELSRVLREGRTNG